MAALILWSVFACAHVVKKQRDKRLYKYSDIPITPERRLTRVLTLAPGGFLDDLKGDIHTVCIDEPQGTRYEALSYVWGVNTSTFDFVKITGSSNRRLWLPSHLALALRYLRYKDRTRTLWVDFICIRRDDLEEKALQVAMMRDIYAAAERVVVWLGTEANESNTALGIMEDLGWMVEFDFENNRMRPSPSGVVEPSWADPTQYLPYDQDELWSIYELIHRSWFGRLWIRQEISVADPSTAIFMCGNKTISWDLLRTALACIANKPRYHLDRSEESSPELRFARRYEMVLLLCQPEKEYTFSDLLDQGRKFNCSDQRDRVYAAMGMASDLDDSVMGLVPDYNLSTSQVYQDAVLRYIAHSKSANILASCEMGASRPTMPSWIPDWSQKRIANTMPMHLASGLAESSVEFSETEAILKTAAVRCGTVKTVQELFGDFVPVPEVIAVVRGNAPQDVIKAAYRGREKGMLEAYCATLAWGLFESFYNPAIDAYPDLDIGIESLKVILEHQDDDSKRASSSYDYSTLIYVTHLLSTCKGRVLFTTEEGHLGLGPRETKSGDGIFVVLGCDVPLVLRNFHDAKSEVVGECYVHGLMTGEALLGELPEGYKMVMDGEDPEEPVRPIFVREGEKLTEDPRLDILRRRMTDSNMKGDLPGVRELLSPDHLRDAGVDVIELRLA